MRVVCQKIVNPATLEIEERNPWISVGREYVVLEILAVPGSYIHLRIDLDSSVSSVWDAAMFETIDQSVPSNWVVEIASDGQLSIGPARWIEAGFWERYFEGDELAIGIFEREVAQIRAES